MVSLYDANKALDDAYSADRITRRRLGEPNLRELRGQLGPNLSVPIPKVPHEIFIDGDCCIIFEYGCFVEARKSTPEEKEASAKGLAKSLDDSLPF